jgi:hypothetical protein
MIVIQNKKETRMSLTNAKVIIDLDGNSTIESLEQSDQCSKWKDIAKRAGKITSEEDKEHTPVFHDVHQKGN